jgi:uncharacterized protein YdeI (YjbR/CyaY-like superfamily)
MGKRIAAVDAYIAKQQPFAKPILVHLRDLVHEVCPDANEVIKWGMPHFDYQGPFAGMAAFKAHATFGFWKEALLRKGKAPLPEPAEKAMGSFGCIRSLDDLPSRRTLASLIREAMKLNEGGVKTPKRPSVPKPAVRPPAWFMAALRKKPRALATYEAFPPGQKREYVEWVTEAKTEATREKRLATTVAWLAEGKRRNWKYEKR